MLWRIFFFLLVTESKPLDCHGTPVLHINVKEYYTVTTGCLRIQSNTLKCLRVVLNLLRVKTNLMEEESSYIKGLYCRGGKSFVAFCLIGCIHSFSVFFHFWCKKASTLIPSPSPNLSSWGASRQDILQVKCGVAFCGICCICLRYAVQCGLH